MSWAVIFSSQRTDADPAGYAAAAVRMLDLAAQQPGYVGVEDARDEDGFGITISYWEDLESIGLWREQAEHLMVQQLGRERWYKSYHLRVCRIERESSFEQTANDG